MNEQLIIEKCRNYASLKLQNDVSGHDFFHVERVVHLAKFIHQKEQKGNLFFIETAAWLHDIGDKKLNGNIEKHNELIPKFLLNLNMIKDDVDKIVEIINNISFSKNIAVEKLNWETKIIQDADRLDAIGAIGIVRTFAYGGKAGNLIHHPEIKPFSKLEITTTINHFYEKLLLLKDKMHTDTARQIAEQRHIYMEQFLQQFYKEWNCE